MVIGLPGSLPATVAAPAFVLVPELNNVRVPNR